MSLKDIFRRASSGEEKRDMPEEVIQRMRRVDFSNIPKLENADLSGANLRNADLRPLHVRQESRTRAKRLWAINKSKHAK